MLTVAASNASGVTVAGSDGSSYSMSAGGGTQAVSPTATTTYTATATGTGGKASSATSVTVVAAAPPAPTVTIAANPTSITAGSSSTLTVTATNATAVTVTGSDGSSYKLSAERRHAGRQPERDDYVYRQRDWSRREGIRGRERYRDGGSNAGDADGGYLGQPHVDNRGELLYFDRDRDQRHRGDGDRLGRQQL